MAHNSQRINSLFERYIDNSITPGEYDEFISLLNEDGPHNELTGDLKELWIQSGKHPIELPGEQWNKKIDFLIKKLDEKDVAPGIVTKFPGRFKPMWAAAVLFILVSSVSVYYALRPSKATPDRQTLAAKNSAADIIPGGNKAILILADGTRITLDSATNGTIASQGTSRVVKVNTGKLVYNSSGSDQNPIAYNELATPRGGQYQVVLADGTIVWLNSKSSLRYPTAFSGAERKVEITGEAYFEVAKDLLHPFKVKINISSGDGGEVEVLGTHFNINAYQGEPNVRTTLLEGAIRLNQSSGTTLLKPGQQLQSGRSGPTKIINDADLEEAVAWKDGRFQFENADIKSVMRQLTNWYDIEVEYQGNISHHFEGGISRNVNLSKVLNMLQLTGEVNFKVEGKKIIVTP